MKITLKESLTVPNALSLFRIILIPFIAVSYFKGHSLLAFILVFVSGLTDTLDGFIARKFNQISTLGKLLDPLADKLTVIVVMICLCVRHSQPPFNETAFLVLVCVMVGKELLMLAGSFFLLKKGARPCASKIWGKLATFVLYVVIGIIIIEDIILEFNIAFTVPPIVITILCIVSCVLVIMALLQYSGLFFAIIRGKYDFEKEALEADVKSRENKEEIK